MKQLHQHQHRGTASTTSKPRYVYGSLTRISNLSTTPFQVKPLLQQTQKRGERSRIPSQCWETGDYIVGRYLGEKDPTIRAKHRLELPTGQLYQLEKGDLVVGSLGARTATQEVVGDWHLIGRDNRNRWRMHDIGGSGLFGLQTSFSEYYYSSPAFLYQGHVIRNGCKVCMKDFVPSPQTVPLWALPPPCPVVVMTGTSMSCGKTKSLQVILQVLTKQLGLKRVLAAKLTGCGYSHDMLESSQNGAHAVVDFVSAGLPSTVGIPKHEYLEALERMFGMMACHDPDCIVIKLGASPWEAYNGNVALQRLLCQRPFLVLSATDPYAVVGFQAFLNSDNLCSSGNPEDSCCKADLVCGMTANTSAGRQLVYDWTGVPALSLATSQSTAKLRVMLEEYLKSFEPIFAEDKETRASSSQDTASCSVSSSMHGEVDRIEI